MLLPRRLLGNFALTLLLTIFTLLFCAYALKMMFLDYHPYVEKPTTYVESAVSTAKPTSISAKMHTKNSFVLNNAEKVSLAFDTPAADKHIQKAYLSFTNYTTLPTNTTRWLYAQTPDGEDVSNDHIFRIVAWETPWMIDITPLVKQWQADPASNKGVQVHADQDIELYSTGSGAPKLTIVSSAEEGLGTIADQVKIDNGFEALKGYDNGPWTWTNVGIANAQLNEVLAGNEAYRKPLEALIGQDVKLTSYYQAPFAKIMIDLDKVKYASQIATMRKLFDTLPRQSGVILDNNSIESELAYLGIDFLAAYGEAYNDKAATKMAVLQMSNLYKALWKGQESDLPYTLADWSQSTGTAWSRGVGWLFAGTGKLLAYPSVKQMPEYAVLLQEYQKMATTIKGHQDSTGLWYSIVNNHYTTLESTGSALLAIGYEYGIRDGLLDKETYSAVLDNAEKGLLSQSLTGTDMQSGFPSNQDLDYAISTFSSTRVGYGLWMELETLLK